MSEFIQAFGYSFLIILVFISLHQEKKFNKKTDCLEKRVAQWGNYPTEIKDDKDESIRPSSIIRKT